MKKIFTVLLALFFILALYNTSWAIEQPVGTIEDAINGANDELKEMYPEKLKLLRIDYFKNINVSGKGINPGRWKESERRLFVYGDPYGDIKHTEDGIRYRYTGETMKGEDFLNPFFPHDEWREGLIIDNFRLYPFPWKERSLQNFTIHGRAFALAHNLFNGDDRYLPHIRKGLERYYPGATFGESSPLWNKWHEYVYIQQPPTKWTWGLGSAFHIDSRGIQWYIPIPLPATVDLAVPDLSTALEAESFTDVKPGEKMTSTVTYTLNVDHPREETAWLRLHHVVGESGYPVKLDPLTPADTPDENGHVKFRPGESKTYRYSFTVQGMTTRILSRINPVSPGQDLDWRNNRDEAVVIPPKYDIKVKITPDENLFFALDGESVTLGYMVRITRKDGIPGEIDVSLDAGDPGGKHSEVIKLGQGYRDIPYAFPASAGSCTIEAEAWPTGKADSYPEDNRDSVTVAVEKLTLDFDSKIRVDITDN